MSAVFIGVAIVVALAALWLVVESAQNRQKNRDLESQMNELRRDLQSMATAQANSAGQMEAMKQFWTLQFGSLGAPGHFAPNRIK